MEPNRPPWSQKDTRKTPKAFKMEPKAYKMEPKCNQRQQKCAAKAINNKNPKRSAPGRQPSFGVLGLERLFSRFIVKNNKYWNPNRCQHSSKFNTKTDTETNCFDVEEHGNSL